MKVFYGINNVHQRFPSVVLAIGVFDGVHLGHQLLIRKAVARARANDGMAMVMTFDPHPVNVLRPENHLPQIISLKYRLKLLASLGVQAVIVVRFTKSFSRLNPESFIRRYLVKKINPVEVIVGDDFRFGQNRTGTLEIFQEAGNKFGFQVCSLSTQRGGQKKFSSTLVRDLIAAGDLKRAAKILGRPVSLMGTVTAGDRRGKGLGYPTANIIPSGELLPPRGVYVVHVQYGSRFFQGMANIGVRPSFRSQERLNVEAHLFDFHQTIYGKEIVVEFLYKIRDELYFPSKESLIAQLAKDEAFCRKWFRRRKN